MEEFDFQFLVSFFSAPDRAGVLHLLCSTSWRDLAICLPAAKRGPLLLIAKRLAVFLHCNVKRLARFDRSPMAMSCPLSGG
jgi:hypothetical protein